MDINRRNFIKALSTSAIGFSTITRLGGEMMSQPYPICIFSKCIQFLDYEELGRTVAAAGFNGVDLTVRNGGHVQPERVKADLPKAVKALRKEGVDVPMIVTEIDDTDGKFSSDILGTAANLGIKYYRLGYFHYDPKEKVFDNLDRYKSKLEALEIWNRKYNIRCGYQNHSGPWGMVGGAVWDLHYLLRDFDPKYIGVQYDIAHAIAEGGYSWAVALKVIKPWVNSLAMKDFLWVPDNKRWETKWVPLGEGMVDFKKFRNEIDPLLASLPITIHYEYDLGGAELGKLHPTMSKEEIVKKITRGLYYFKQEIWKKKN